MKLKNLKRRLGTQMLVLILVFSFLLFLFFLGGELVFLEVKVKLSKTVTTPNCWPSKSFLPDF